MRLPIPLRTWPLGAFVVIGLILTGCGSDGDSDPAVPDADAVASDPESAAGELAEGLEGQQEASGGGSATLTIGADEYTFDKVLCAIGTDETGNPDWEFSLSAIANGMQLSVETGPTYGDSASLNDIEDFENPKVAWTSEGDGFLTIDGGEVSGKTKFRDGTDDTGQTSVSGELAASCP